jgi:hypothetical protein
MQILSIQPFVPSGPDHEQSKRFFHELGFTVAWDAGDYTGFACNNSRFILQKFNDRNFAENFMISVAVPDVEALQKEINEKRLTEKFDVKFSQILDQPYGRELNLIDLAGVCWHFVEQR